MSDSSSRILSQVEYYFGDSNYVRDAFLQKSASEHEGGWIPIATLLTFNRLKSLTTDPAVVLAALRTRYSNNTTAAVAPVAASTEDVSSVEESTEDLLPLLAISEDGLSLRRVRPVPTANDEEIARRTRHVKGFPQDIGLDEITPAFAEFNTSAIRLRRFNGAFKGAVFVEFKTEEEAARYDSQPRTFNDAPLEVTTKKEFEEKGKDKDDDSKKKGKKKEDSKKEDKEEDKEEEEEKEEKEIPKDCLVHFENAGEETSREDLKVTTAFTSIPFHTTSK